MLREISDLTQTSDNLNRRWFADTEMDLFVWYDRDANIIKFQISYDKNKDEQVITWNSSNGFSHHLIDDNRSPDRMKASPLLSDRSRLEVEKVTACFIRSGQKLEHELYEYVLNRLQQHSSHS